MLRIFTHNNGSQGLANLREHMEPLIRGLNEAQGSRGVRPIMSSENGNARIFQATNRIVLNWGSSAELTQTEGNLVINQPNAVGNATHKLRFFQRMNAWNQENENRAVPIPEWTTSRDEAQDWAGFDHLVYARTRLQGHSGEGIVVYRRNDVVERAPLYTKGIVGARREYRVHVVGGKVALVQLKKRRNGAGTATGEADTVRNLDSGWIYAVSDARPSRIVLEAATNAIAALGLDFGAVDIIAKGRKGAERECWVLEVNTAPGQRGDTTVTVYARGLVALYALWLGNRATQSIEVIRDLWHTLDWQNNSIFELMLRQQGVERTTINNLIRADNEAHAVTNGDNEDGEDAPFVDEAPTAEADFAAAPSRAHVINEAPPVMARRVEPAQQRQFNGNPFDARLREPGNPVEPMPATQLPTRSVGVSRLGRNDPQNEQFVLFNWNGRREVGVVNTQRGVVYMAGSEMPIPAGTVEMIAVVDTEIR